MRTVSLNGTNYSVPEPGDTAYDQALSDYLVALATAFPHIANATTQALGAELDLGALFGIRTLYVKSETANPGATGVLRLSKTDSIVWRNNANTSDLPLGISASDVLQFGGGTFLTSPFTSEVDFGGTAGVKSLYYKSRATTVAAAGVLRLAGGASADSIAWRNNANSGDLGLTVNAGDQLLFNGSVVQTGTSGTVPNPLIAPAAASLGLEGNVSDGATAVGVKIGNANTLANAAAKIASFFNDAITTEKAYVAADGSLASDKHKAFSANSVTVQGAIADGASAVGVVLDNSTTLSNAGAKIVSVRNNNTEKAYIDTAGTYVGPVSPTPVLIADTSTTSILTGGTRTIVVFSNVVADTDSGYSAVTGRYTVPTGKGGKYWVSASIAYDTSTSTAPSTIEFWKNGAFYRILYINQNAYSVGTLDLIVPLAAGDIVDIRAHHGSASNLPLGNPGGSGATAAACNWFTLQRLGL